MRWHEVTAFMGGTFDPPHLGHREAVEGLFENPGVSQVRILPSPVPPQKARSTSLEHRIAMTRLAFGRSSMIPFSRPVELDLREIKRAETQPGIASYTFDTLSELKREFPMAAFVIGTDQLAGLPTWHRFPEILGLSHWIVLERKGETPGTAILKQWESSGLVREEAGAWRTFSREPAFLKVVPTSARKVSSTEIRENLAKSSETHIRAAETALLPEVLDYLKRHRLYGTGGPSAQSTSGL